MPKTLATPKENHSGFYMHLDTETKQMLVETARYHDRSISAQIRHMVRQEYQRIRAEQPPCPSPAD